MDKKCIHSCGGRYQIEKIRSGLDSKIKFLLACFPIPTLASALQPNITHVRTSPGSSRDIKVHIFNWLNVKLILQKNLKKYEYMCCPFQMVREAPFWNVLALYGHCPNSFRPPPPLSNRQTWKKKCPKSS